MHGFAQVTDLIDAVVGGTVDLDHVEVGAGGDGLAGRIGGIEVGLRAAGAVEGLGENARGRGLAGAARPDEEVGMRDAAAGDGVAQGADDVILADDVVKGLRTPFAGDDLVGGLRHG